MPVNMKVAAGGEQSLKSGLSDTFVAVLLKTRTSIKTQVSWYHGSRGQSPRTAYILRERCIALYGAQVTRKFNGSHYRPQVLLSRHDIATSQTQHKAETAYEARSTHSLLSNKPKEARRPFPQNASGAAGLNHQPLSDYIRNGLPRSEITHSIHP